MKQSTAAQSGRFGLALVFLGLGLAGCGIYSLRFEPPRQSSVFLSRRGPPLDLSVSRGELSYSLDGKPVSRDAYPAVFKRADDAFVHIARAAGFFRDVQPRGSRTDLYYDEVADVDTGQPSVSRSVYKIVAFLPALVLPGVPYPWQLHGREQVRFRGTVNGTTVTVKEYTVDYTCTIWTATYWGVITSQSQILAAEEKYQADALSEALERDYDAFKQFEVATRQGQQAPVGEHTAEGAPPPSWNSAVVRIRSKRGLGSGFFVTDNLIATNAHVVHGSKGVWVSFSEGAEQAASVAYEDDELDFALVRSSVLGTPLPGRKSPLKDGEDVMAVGFPQGRRVLAGSTGTVSKIFECCIEHNALIAGGSSGGPLLDLNGNVVGINTLLVKAKGDRKNESDRTWALKMSYIWESLSLAGEGQEQ